MGYRILVHMMAVSGAEARLWALLSQRHIDVTAASFQKDRTKNRIQAILDVNLDLTAVRRLMRQLERHYDIQQLALESTESFPHQMGQGPINYSRRVRISAKRGACL